MFGREKLHMLRCGRCLTSSEIADLYTQNTYSSVFYDDTAIAEVFDNFMGKVLYCPPGHVEVTSSGR